MFYKIYILIIKFKHSYNLISLNYYHISYQVEIMLNKEFYNEIIFYNYYRFG